jgi:hypothetical protein
MKNFKINNPDEPPVSASQHLFDVGTSFTFQKIGNELKAIMHVPIQFA